MTAVAIPDSGNASVERIERPAPARGPGRRAVPRSFERARDRLVARATDTSSPSARPREAALPSTSSAPAAAPTSRSRPMPAERAT
jgi:hypothetical protein